MPVCNCTCQAPPPSMQTERQVLVAQMTPSDASSYSAAAGYSPQATATPSPRLPWHHSHKGVPDVVSSAEYPPRSPPAATSTAKPIRQFQFLDRKYGVETPSCLIPVINELFKSVCERYDIAVTNREKVDEALLHFRRVLEVQPSTSSMEETFRAWRSHLVNPHFNVKFKEPSGDVKEITVRADEVPRSKRKAQKFIRDLLDACDLFLQQREFLQRHIAEDLAELERLSGNLSQLTRDVTSKLSMTEQRQLPRTVRSAQATFARFPRTIDMFWEQVFALMYEINTSVYVLREPADN